MARLGTVLLGLAACFLGLVASAAVAQNTGGCGGVTCGDCVCNCSGGGGGGGGGGNSTLIDLSQLGPLGELLTNLLNELLGNGGVVDVQALLEGLGL